MYGENPPSRPTPPWERGLSPHVRGKPSESAGRTPQGWVYPRMYGETHLVELYRDRVVGLSPHVRGNR